MKTKLTTLAEAVSRIPSGATIAIGGSMVRRQPNALARELIRQGKKDLTVLTFCAGSATDLLAAAGVVKRWEGVYSGLFWYGQSYNFRRAVENGQLEVRDFTEGSMVARFRAAAQGVSFAPTRALLGTDMAKYNPEQVREIRCPFTNETYHAVAAAEADFTLLHGYIGDEYGNVQMPIIRDSDDIDALMAMASKRLIVTVERIVPHETIIRHPLLTYIPHNLVEAIVHAPYGAHPVACDAFYDTDDDHMAEYVEMSKNGQAGTYLEHYVLGGDEWSYLEKAGGLQKLMKLNVGGAG
ncbi:MAG: hypothetical protein BAA01_09765 [Bacillus thermozeamaize]|uniref:CoA-transferase n=1 Tax=Bacillus thermozeamaize TaxID=230954 RepID=A0A1Y3PNG3_9BACI|nr:MAG: hypothetical protein BAA01_09765 [Bacillus thermozeamaize]